MPAWARVLRAHDLSATAVALHVLERAPPTPFPEIARMLADAGYSDAEILRALLENGARHTPTLDHLRSAGWSVGRTARALSERGMLAPEIREQLRSLGVPRRAIADALHPHLPADVVALVAGDDASDEA